MPWPIGPAPPTTQAVWPAREWELAPEDSARAVARAVARAEDSAGDERGTHHARRPTRVESRTISAPARSRCRWILLATIAALRRRSRCSHGAPPRSHTALDTRHAACKSACRRATSPDVLAQCERLMPEAGWNLPAAPLEDALAAAEALRGRTTPAATQSSLASTRSRARTLLASQVADDAKHAQLAALCAAARAAQRPKSAELAFELALKRVEKRRIKDKTAALSRPLLGEGLRAHASLRQLDKFEALLASDDDIGAEPTVLSARSRARRPPAICSTPPRPTSRWRRTTTRPRSRRWRRGWPRASVTATTRVPSTSISR